MQDNHATSNFFVDNLPKFGKKTYLINYEHEVFYH